MEFVAAGSTSKPRHFPLLSYWMGSSLAGISTNVPLGPRTHFTLPPVRQAQTHGIPLHRLSS